MSSQKDDFIISTGQLLYPVALLSFVMFGFLGFQTMAIMDEHKGLKGVRTQQEEPLTQAKKVQTQLDALALGTLKLSEKGNKDAAAIIANLKKLGITVTPPKAEGAAATKEAPAAKEAAPAAE